MYNKKNKPFVSFRATCFKKISGPFLYQSATNGKPPAVF